MPGTAFLSAAERRFVQGLQHRALRYFFENQTPSGLVLDRQSNHGPRRAGGLCSTSATGMGWIALALASAAPYRLLRRSEAVRRLRTGLDTTLNRLPHDHGIVPHFVDARTGAVRGHDTLSTVDSAWLVAGALWAAAFLGDPRLEERAARLFERVDWQYWTGDLRPLLSHGRAPDGRMLRCTWDRLNGETVFLYVLATGAARERALPSSVWRCLRPFYGTVEGLRFNNADLGLFVFQYGLDLLDLSSWPVPGGVDITAEAAVATEANCRACRAAADRFATYRRLWGLSAGDGPADVPSGFAYRCYAPAGPVDGTAHVTATLASLAHRPELVLDNLRQAAHFGALGRYGFSNINLDRNWMARDMVGIDAGATVLALDNFLEGDRVRRVFHRLSCVQQSLQRGGFTRTDTAPTARAA
jgi:hypothetical protein